MRVLLFAALRELAGASRLELELVPPDVDALIAQLTNAYGPEFARIMAASSVVVNGETAGRDHPLDAGDEVALLPPVSGGGVSRRGREEYRRETRRFGRSRTA